MAECLPANENCTLAPLDIFYSRSNLHFKWPHTLTPRRPFHETRFVNTFSNETDPGQPVSFSTGVVCRLRKRNVAFDESLHLPRTTVGHGMGALRGFHSSAGLFSRSHKPMACFMFSVLAPFIASRIPWKQSSMYGLPTRLDTTGIGSCPGTRRLISWMSP